MLNDLDSAEEISTRVDRLLHAADAYGRFPTPVEDIVAAAELGHADDYVLDESLISKAPAYLRTLLRSAKDKIQGLIDRRARIIHISPHIDHDGKRRFVTLHETIHQILPHQQDLLYADDNETLSPSTNRLFEREANQGAAELLFQRTRFTQDAADTEISIAAIWDLTRRYGSSFHAAVRRYAETHPGAVAAIVLERTPSSTDPHIWARQELMTTPAWTARFGPARWPRMMNAHSYPLVPRRPHRTHGGPGQPHRHQQRHGHRASRDLPDPLQQLRTAVDTPTAALSAATQDRLSRDTRT